MTLACCSFFSSLFRCAGNHLDPPWKLLWFWPWALILLLCVLVYNSIIKREIDFYVLKIQNCIWQQLLKTIFNNENIKNAFGNNTLKWKIVAKLYLLIIITTKPTNIVRAIPNKNWKYLKKKKKLNETKLCIWFPRCMNVYIFNSLIFTNFQFKGYPFFSVRSLPSPTVEQIFSLNLYSVHPWMSYLFLAPLSFPNRFHFPLPPLSMSSILTIALVSSTLPLDYGDWFLTNNSKDCIGAGICSTSFSGSYDIRDPGNQALGFIDALFFFLRKTEERKQIHWKHHFDVSSIISI